jgi:uncharacterized membrane protein
MVVLMILLMVAMCFSLFNYWFQNDKYKRLSKEEKSKLNWINSPTAWLIYSILSILGTFFLIGYLIYNFFVAAFKMG